MSWDRIGLILISILFRYEEAGHAFRQQQYGGAGLVQDKDKISIRRASLALQHSWRFPAQQSTGTKRHYSFNTSLPGCSGSPESHPTQHNIAVQVRIGHEVLAAGVLTLLANWGRCRSSHHYLGMRYAQETTEENE